VALVLIAWAAIAWIAARFLIVNTPLNHADAIVVLSGAAVYRERTERAADYYRQGVADRILITNDNLRGEWSSTEQRNPFFHERARNNLLTLGVPADRVELIPDPVANTSEEAQALKRYAEVHKLKSLLVVTSAYHSRRALWTLGKVFKETAIKIGIRSVEGGEQTPSPSTWWLYTRGWQMVAGEYVKMAYYFVTE
jgi:uncharacterized SAM-binding protein YcdF (DUF218 family)